MPLTGDGSGQPMGSFKGSPLCRLGDKHPVRMKNGKWTAAAACYIQNALRQMMADKAGTVRQTAGFIQQQPFFGGDLQPASI